MQAQPNNPGALVPIRTLKIKNTNFFKNFYWRRNVFNFVL